MIQTQVGPANKRLERTAEKRRRPAARRYAELFNCREGLWGDCFGNWYLGWCRVGGCSGGLSRVRAALVTSRVISFVLAGTSPFGKTIPG